MNADTAPFTIVTSPFKPPVKLAGVSNVIQYLDSLPRNDYVEAVWPSGEISEWHAGNLSRFIQDIHQEGPTGYELGVIGPGDGSELWSDDLGYEDEDEYLDNRDQAYINDREAAYNEKFGL